MGIRRGFSAKGVAHQPRVVRLRACSTAHTLVQCLPTVASLDSHASAKHWSLGSQAQGPTLKPRAGGPGMAGGGGGDGGGRPPGLLVAGQHQHAQGQRQPRALPVPLRPQLRRPHLRPLFTQPRRRGEGTGQDGQSWKAQAASGHRAQAGLPHSIKCETPCRRRVVASQNSSNYKTAKLDHWECFVEEPPVPTPPEPSLLS